MKANELMIGDWVYNKNIDKPMQVYPMMFSQMFRRTPDATTEDYNIFPIPLTPEILKKYGFVEKSEHRWVLSDEYTGDEVLVLCEVANAFAMFTSGLAIGFQNVHELQHILKLHGIEEEIEL